MLRIWTDFEIGYCNNKQKQNKNKFDLIENNKTQKHIMMKIRCREKQKKNQNKEIFTTAAISMGKWKQKRKSTKWKVSSIKRYQSLSISIAKKSP